MIIRNSAACLASVILFSASLQAAPVKVFLLAGQSNMRGMGNPAGVKAPYTESPATVKSWEGKSREALVAKGKNMFNEGHCNSAGLITIGTRFAEAFNNLKK